MKYICDSHAEALAELVSIENCIVAMQNTDPDSISASMLADWCDMLGDYAHSAKQLIKEAKETGIRMERGLSRKRDKIEELDQLNSELESENSDLKSEIADLKWEISGLLENLENCND